MSLHIVRFRWVLTTGCRNAILSIRKEDKIYRWWRWDAVEITGPVICLHHSLRWLHWSIPLSKARWWVPARSWILQTVLRSSLWTDLPRMLPCCPSPTEGTTTPNSTLLNLLLHFTFRVLHFAVKIFDVKYGRWDAEETAKCKTLNVKCKSVWHCRSKRIDIYGFCISADWMPQNYTMNILVAVTIILGAGVF